MRGGLKKFIEVSLLEKEEDSHLNMEEITNADYMHRKKSF